LATWSELSDYTHFSSKFLDVIVNRPNLLFINDFDEKLFKKCVNLVFTIFDAICAVLIIHFPKIGDEIREILKWWKENLNRTFILTENIF